MTAKPRLTSAHRVCGGIFTPDPDVPADHNGLRVCRCNLLGQPGDAHHTLPPPVPDVQSLRAGERSKE